jgi:hypothetical protein
MSSPVKCELDGSFHSPKIPRLQPGEDVNFAITAWDRGYEAGAEDRGMFHG